MTKGGIGFSGLLTLILLLLKVFGVIQISWFLVFLPVIISTVIALLILAVVLAIVLIAAILD